MLWKSIKEQIDAFLSSILYVCINGWEFHQLFHYNTNPRSRIKAYKHRKSVFALCFLLFFDDDIWYFLSGATSVCFIAFVVRYKYIFNIEKELCFNRSTVYNDIARNSYWLTFISINNSDF